mgnify:CR=1 FL=1
MKIMLNKVLLALMFALSFIGTIAFRISMPAIAFFTRRVLEASALSVGLLTSSFFTARAIFSIITGSLADKFCRKVIYGASLCFILNGLVVQLYALAESVLAVLCVRFLQGMLNGVSWVSVQFVLGKSVSENVRGRVYAIYFALGTLGIAAGNILYSIFSNYPMVYILNISSALFAISSMLSLIIGLSFKGSTVLNIKKTKKTAAVGKSEERRLIKAVPLMVVVLGTTFFSSMVRGDLIYIYINESFNVTKAIAAEVVAFTSLIALIGGYVLSWISDSFGDLFALKIALTIAVVGSIVMGANVFTVAIMGLVLFYIANSGILPISRRIAITHYRLGGTTLGLINASGNIGAVIGAFVIGYLYDVFNRGSVVILGAKLTVFVLLSSLTLIASLIVSLLFLKRS